jgi:hypothetical protein
VVESFGIDSVALVELRNRVNRKFGVWLPADVLSRYPTIAELVAFLVDSASRAHVAEPTSGPSRVNFICRPRNPQACEGGQAKLPSCILVLTSTCSGSSMLQLVLNMHPALFAPQELHLLPYLTAGERADKTAGLGLDEGLLRTLMHLEGLSLDAAKQALDTMAREDVPTQSIWRTVQALASPRILCEKSPTNAMDLATLQRAESIFDRPMYIHLVRHPFAAIASSAKLRAKQLLLLGVESPSSDPRASWQTQEDHWAQTNSNILQFLKGVPQSRQATLRYEDLVREPASQLQGLCATLGLPYCPQMCTPYQESNLALFRAADAHQPSTNHPDVLKHDGIDPSLADAWQSVHVPRPLSSHAWSIATQLR